MRHVGHCFAALLAFAAGAGTDAATVYQCGTQGSEFSAVPCAEGRPLDVEDRRTPAQQREAQIAAARDARLADQLAQERRAREAEPGRRAAGIGRSASPAAAPASQPAKKRKKHRASSPREDGLSPPYRAAR
jgi:hypothetical protein